MSSKDFLLSQLKPAVSEQLRTEIAEGRLDVSEEYDFETNFDRIYVAVTGDALMRTTMKAFKITKEDLRQLARECLIEAGVRLVELC